MHKILVVDDDKILQSSVKQILEFHNFSVEIANNGREAVHLIETTKYDAIIMDVNMPEMNGLDALEYIKNYDPSVIVIIVTAHSDYNDAVRAVKLGAYNYIEKPISSENLVKLIKRAIKARSFVETSQFSAPKLKLDTDDKFVGNSDKMKEIFCIISKLSQVNAPVLIRGESGTGKELVAKAIHFNGPRKNEKFITINLAAIPPELIESELFGYEKGAFIGANERKIGKLQYADGGTIFLDEIGDISIQIQIKLLRILQEKKFTPIGSNRDISVDIRILAASHQSFETLIEEKKFRQDLFYRLNVLPVYLPPLRERKSDIDHLINYYISYFNQLHGVQILGIETLAKQQFHNYAWPGNIRELRNVIEYAFIMESGQYLKSSSFPECISHQIPPEDDESDSIHEQIIDIKTISSSVVDSYLPKEDIKQYSFHFIPKNQDCDVTMDFQIAKEIFEKEFITKALEINKGKINQTALKSNMPKKTLLRKISKYEINPKIFKI